MASFEIAKDFLEDLELEQRILAHLRMQDIVNIETLEEVTDIKKMDMRTYVPYKHQVISV